MTIDVRWTITLHFNFIFKSCTDLLKVSAAHERSAIPKFQEYATAGGKEVLKTLQSAAELVPVPLLRNALGVAIKVIEVCEVSILIVRVLSKPALPLC